MYIRVALQGKAGGWTGSIDMPQQRLIGFPLVDIAVDGDEVRFSLPGTPGEPMFNGSLVESRISGQFRQGSSSNAFYLAREPLEIPGMMSAEQAAGIIDGQQAAYNAHDLDAFMTFFHADIEVYSFPGELDKSGLASLRESFANTFQTAPYERFITRIISGNHVIDEVKVKFQVHDQALVDRSTVIYTLEDGLIRRMTFL